MTEQHCLQVRFTIGDIFLVLDLRPHSELRLNSRFCFLVCGIFCGFTVLMAVVSTAHEPADSTADEPLMVRIILSFEPRGWQIFSLLCYHGPFISMADFISGDFINRDIDCISRWSRGMVTIGLCYLGYRWYTHTSKKQSTRIRVWEESIDSVNCICMYFSVGSFDHSLVLPWIK